MLILARKEGEKVMIGDDIEIMVARIDRGQVRLSVRAPRDVEIRRAELPRTGRAGGRR